MPDTGYNGYVHVNPDGTVVVPINLSLEGLIQPADLVTQDQLAAGLDDTLATAETYADDGDAIVQANVDDVQTNLDNLSADVVHGAGMQISDEYSVDLDYAAAQLSGQAIVVNGVAEIAWPSWVVVGQYVAVLGHVTLSGVQASGTDLTLNFNEIGTGPEAILGTYFFRILGTP